MDSHLYSEEIMEWRLEKLNELSYLHLDDYDMAPESSLFPEKGIIHNFLEIIDETGIPDVKENVKSIEISTQLRLQGNQFYNKLIHDREIHYLILQLYTECIAVAPSNSEELALGYGSRSALLLHLKSYQYCINDCDRALGITAISSLKLKLLHRKILCLIALKEKSTKRVYDEALSFLETCTVDKKRKREFREKFDDMSRSISEMTFDEQIKEEKNIDKELPSFKPNKEASCASESVAIAHDEIWGRHIVAERDIDPGEIVVVEKNYISYLDPTEMYAFCTTCMKPSLCLIPCDNCIYDVYCSEECKLEAWTKFHQFECPIYCYLGSGRSEVKLLFFYLRYVLVSVYNAGGIDKLRKELIAVANCKDVRKKGFMDDGKFHSDQPRSCLCIKSVLNDWEETEAVKITTFVNKTCYTVYYLATQTDFFGEVFNLTPAQIIHNPHMMLFAGLLLKCFFSLCSNKLVFHVHSLNFEPSSIGSSIWPFSCMFNHSCFPNASHFMTENKELVIYANQPIKKGSQIFINYYDIHFLSCPRVDRQEYFEAWYSFQCECIPCQEYWSDICLPGLKDLLNTTPELAAEVNAVIQKNNQVIKQLYTENFVYNKEILEKIVEILKVIAEKVTVCCKEFVYYQGLMRRMFVMTFDLKADFLECISLDKINLMSPLIFDFVRMQVNGVNYTINNRAAAHVLAPQIYPVHM